MKLEEILDRALEEEFKAYQVVESIKKIITNRISERVLEEYKDIKVTNWGVEYKLLGVDVYVKYTYPGNLKSPNVTIKLILICISKMPKRKREILNNMIEKFNQTGTYYPIYHDFKIPVEFSPYYDLSIYEALNEPLNFDLKFND